MDEKPTFIRPPQRFTQVTDNGIRYDFNLGLRMQFPAKGGPWHYVVTDAESGALIGEGTAKYGEAWQSPKSFVIDYHVEINGTTAIDFDPTGQTVIMQSPSGALGDSLAWVPKIERFRQKYNAKVYVEIPKAVADLLEPAYPHIHFCTREELEKLAPISYATVYIGLWFKGDDDAHNCTPFDHRLVGLQPAIAHLLNVDPCEDRPLLPDTPYSQWSSEPYAVISAQSTTLAKCWMNPTGWDEVIDHLKARGMRVVCIDRDRVAGRVFFNHIPAGCEDMTGKLPLADRVDVLRGAKVFIGLPSGLSWLAWACRVPVVMISGFSAPWTEFSTPYRVQSRLACSHCWNDQRHLFDHFDWTWCPRHAGTPRQFECTRLITGKMVIEQIRKALG